MPRLAALAAAVALTALFAGVAQAEDTASQSTHLLSWPGKDGAYVPPATPHAGSASSVGAPASLALSRQFFGAKTDDLAAPPPPLMPRPVPGTQAVTSTATANTPTNRARQNEILTADSAADGPVGGAGSSN